MGTHSNNPVICNTHYYMYALWLHTHACITIFAAAQMWLVARILPLVIGDLVPDDDDRWSNFLLMMEIVDLLFCPKIQEDHTAYLAALISDHHEHFSELYPNDSIIPKMHFMIHMPRLMLR